MGERSFFKYFTLFRLAFRLARALMEKAAEVKAPESEGGVKITPDEWIDIGGVIADQIMAAVPEVQAVVMIQPTDALYVVSS